MVAEVKIPTPDSNGPQFLRGGIGGCDGSNTQCLQRQP